MALTQSVDWISKLGNVQYNDLDQLGLPFCSAQALADRDVLVALYNATNGASWTRNSTNWLSDRPLGEWYGVTTDANGRVTELDLTQNRLSGDRFRQNWATSPT